MENTINTLNGVTERAGYARLLSLGEESTVPDPDQSAAGDLLRHYAEQTKTIIREVLSNSNLSDSTLWKVAEECYKQATSPSGSLDPDVYMDQRAKSSSFAEDSSDAKRRQAYRRCWVDFWIQAVNKSADGPTLFHLFYPPVSLGSEPLDFNPENVPTSLFRTCGRKSPGNSNAEIFSSILSTSGSQESRADLLALEEEKVTTLPYHHLYNPSFTPAAKDNLMSWTSSPLFAIQCAIWKLHKGYESERRASDINVCIVEPRNFPPGQFARDTWLLGSYRETAMHLGKDFQRFWELRDREEYYNGEYLSQGTLNHSNRSCLASLDQLVEAGLYELYPELDDSEGKTKWTNRIKELRLFWSGKQTTKDDEIVCALKLRSYLSPSSPLHMALMLLAFKNCELKSEVPNLEKPPSWATRPVEVRRYWKTAEDLQSCGKASPSGNMSMNDNPLANYESLRGMFA
ncbi:hypothetical protein PG994_003409 [Apiospora phragmitis]|uniref:Uncharacterized protein n=1 Tax=Apiospora phragmitis TaxID=2905665 RepID=A0ABR1VY72_9PEZI